jgi:hypothetical protein
MKALGYQLEAVGRNALAALASMRGHALLFLVLATAYSLRPTGVPRGQPTARREPESAP